jgi:hypothetical protein
VIVETTPSLTTNITYFTIPSETFPALSRVTTITNNLDEDMDVEMLDGLTQLEPAGGLLDGQLKNMGRTLEGWMDVYHPTDAVNDGTKLPFYRLSTVPGDTASVTVQVSGHYCFAFAAKGSLLDIVYDTSKVFGQNTGYDVPSHFNEHDVESIVAGKQSGAAKTSSCFSVSKVVLKPGESYSVYSYYGKADKIDDIDGIVTTVLSSDTYTVDKLVEMRAFMDHLQDAVSTNTADALFNGHVKQMYLDNLLRGGVPFILGDKDVDARGKKDVDEDNSLKVYHTFSRIHGDLERDYNSFTIDSTYFSQGPGNYRDVAQNRRNDVIFTPRMASFNVKMFLSFIQADSYEPLTVQAVSFSIGNANVEGDVNEVAEELASWSIGDQDDVKDMRESLVNIFKGGQLRPGQLFQLMEEQGIQLKEGVSKDDFINKFASVSQSNYMAVYGDGYWADHWEYYLDLIESYNSIYPDREEYVMYDTDKLPYFYSPATCQPRSKKYVATLVQSGVGEHVQQLGATTWDNDKTTIQNGFLKTPDAPWKDEEANWQHDANGNVFKSEPIAKLFLLGTLKFATRDPYGMGVEYEGGKPGWNDAMNGLVGMIGSGMPETYELQLILKYVEKIVSTYDRGFDIPEELNDMLTSVGEALDALEASNFSDEDVPAYLLTKKVPRELFEYWDAVATARETYRDAIKYTFSGETVTLSADTLKPMLARFIKHVDVGMARAMKVGSRGDGDDGNTGVSPSYFSYNATSWTDTGEVNADGHSYVNVKGFAVGTFPLFLEGPVRMMKTLPRKGGEAENMRVFENVKNSGLYDEKLNAYTVSASLVGQSYDMGRMMAFSPGWLENQSVWTHMSYKFYLQLLRGGLYEQFFKELKGGSMLPFVDFDKYGRSLLECSSFIASSAFPDEDQHGRGFLARLSGSTAEFLSIWVLMFIGKQPFQVNKNSGELELVFEPVLPAWAFDEKGEVGYKLFSEIDVTYHTDGGGDLVGKRPHKYEVYFKSHDGKDVVEAEVLPEYIAQQARRLDLKSIDVYF